MSKAIALLAQVLQQNGIAYSLEADTDNPSISIEITQLFSNANCAMTHLQQDWRSNPFPKDTLPAIRIALSDVMELSLAAWDIRARGISKDSRQAVNQTLVSLIAQANSSMTRALRVIADASVPMVTLQMTFVSSGWTLQQFAEQMLKQVQIFALEIHRVFGNATYGQLTGR
jgi:hypothetical protein